MACLIASSVAPSVVSPPCKWTIGIFARCAATAAAKVSNLSSSNIIQSGVNLPKASANPIKPSPVDFVDRYIGIRRQKNIHLLINYKSILFNFPIG